MKKMKSSSLSQTPFFLPSKWFPMLVWLGSKAPFQGDLGESPQNANRGSERGSVGTTQNENVDDGSEAPCFGAVSVFGAGGT